MSLEPPPLKLTYEDYLQLPEDRRCELIGGDFYSMTPAPSVLHQWISRELQFRLELHLRKTGQGLVFNAPIDVYLSEHDVVQPDLVVLLAKRKGMLQKSFIQGCPDIVVEILSPSSSQRDRGLKKHLYDRHGAGEYWIVDPEARTLTVFRRESGRLEMHRVLHHDETLATKALPGLAIPVRELFPSGELERI